MFAESQNPDANWSPQEHAKTPAEVARISSALESNKFSDLFQSFTSSEMAKFINYMEKEEVSAGTNIMTQDEEGDYFYVSAPSASCDASCNTHECRKPTHHHLEEGRSVPDSLSPWWTDGPTNSPLPLAIYIHAHAASSRARAAAVRFFSPLPAVHHLSSTLNPLSPPSLYLASRPPGARLWYRRLRGWWDEGWK